MHKNNTINPYEIRRSHDEAMLQERCTQYDNLRCYHPSYLHHMLVPSGYVLLNLEDRDIVDAIESEDETLFLLLAKYLHEEKSIHEAKYYFDNFNYYILQGHNINYALKYFLKDVDIEIMRKHCGTIIMHAHKRLFPQLCIAEECREALRIYENSIKNTGNIKNRRTEFSRKRNQLMLSIIDRDGYVCQNCKTTKNLTVDHILALSNGGTDDLSNLQLLCRPCNSRKCAN